MQNLLQAVQKHSRRSCISRCVMRNEMKRIEANYSAENTDNLK